MIIDEIVYAKFYRNRIKYWYQARDNIENRYDAKSKPLAHSKL